MSKYLDEFTEFHPKDPKEWGATDIELYCNFISLKEKLGTIQEVEAHVCGH